MRDLGEVLGPIVAMIFIFGVPGILIFWHMYTRSKERMKLIEKGLTPDEVKSLFKADVKRRTRKNNPLSALKWGLLLIFAGMGFVIANVLEETLDMGDGASFGVILIWGGIGVIIYYVMAKKQVAKEEAAELNQDYRIKSVREA